MVLLGRNRVLSKHRAALGTWVFALCFPFATGVSQPWSDAPAWRWLKGRESFFLLPAAAGSAVCPTAPESPWLAVLGGSHRGHCVIAEQQLCSPAGGARPTRCGVGVLVPFWVLKPSL